MAYATNELFSSANKAAQLRIVADTMGVKSFAAGSGTLTKGTPVAFDTVTNSWKVWTNGGVNGTGIIKGFVWPDDVALDASDEVMGQVLMSGTLHYDDIVLPSGESAGNLATALRDEDANGLTARDKGFHIQGLAEVH